MSTVTGKTVSVMSGKKIAAALVVVGLALPITAGAGVPLPPGVPAPPGVNVRVSGGVPVPLPPGVNVSVDNGEPARGEMKGKHRGKHEGKKKGHYKHKKHGH